MIPVPGLELAFDRADGRLCRAVVDAAGDDGSFAVGEQAAAMLIRLFGPEALGLVSGTGSRDGPPTRVLSSEPGLTATLSSLARLDAARATSPVPPGLALVGRRGRRARRTCRPARAGPRRGPAKRWSSCSGSWTASTQQLPAEAVRTAIAAAAIHAVTDPQAAGRLRGKRSEELIRANARTARRRVPGSTWRPRSSAWNRTAVRLGGLQLDARSRPGARRALPARAVALLGPLRTA